MEAVKGLARRTTQSFREMLANKGTTCHEAMLDDVSKRVLQYQKAGRTISVKLMRAVELMEEFGKVLKDIGEEYQKVPELQQESNQLAADVIDFGAKLVTAAQVHHKKIKDEGLDALSSFRKNCSKLRDAERSRRKSQLEYDFFHRKVMDLRCNAPKDTCRIPRNEQKMENWRVEYWRTTEYNKVVCSQLYSEGQRAIDLSVFSLVNVLGSFFNFAAGACKQQFVNARLPAYSDAPILPLVPLPPSPLPPYQPPRQPGECAPAMYEQ